MSAWLVRDSLIDFKEVTVHWTHGNAVVNHTLCVLMVDISIPQKPHFLPLFWSSLMSGAWHQSRLKCVVCKDWLSVQEKLSFDCWCKGTTIWSWKQIFPLQIFLVVSVSVWLIVLYNDISEINCCILTDFEENEGLWLRILEKRSFGHGHVRSKSFSGALGHPII